MSNKRSSKKREKGSSQNSYNTYFNRSVETKEQRKWFLIVCEGEKTEPNYFKSFPVNKEVINLDIQGDGLNTISLVEETIKLKKEGEYSADNNDEVWCVFDRDSFPPQNFNAAITRAQSNDIKVAYSNEAFELWYLLHFNYYDTAMSRKNYKSMLTNLLGHKYEKNSPTIYDELKDKQEKAIKHAKRLLEAYNPPKPEQDNPSTTVHLLVVELNKFIH